MQYGSLAVDNRHLESKTKSIDNSFQRYRQLKLQDGSQRLIPCLNPLFYRRWCRRAYYKAEGGSI